ncbi:hypothetical protein ThrDRAFT_04567 [Frankia casuarinae]|nr:hypothetical protein CcI6DRAFT_04719 [Frankia sp. CcI6]EYT89818.1 hypothetical protein ThrDRAFT_04567 [Frankia casuarinae]KDA40715.1 hypothetical protein BMG523Draft_04468 [Frankia sp. BMG5.23]
MLLADGIGPLPGKAYPSYALAGTESYRTTTSNVF